MQFAWKCSSKFLSAQGKPLALSFPYRWLGPATRSVSSFEGRTAQAPALLVLESNFPKEDGVVLETSSLENVERGRGRACYCQIHP